MGPRIDDGSCRCGALPLPFDALVQVALKEFAFGVRHDEMLDDTFLCHGIVVQEEV